MDSSSNVRNSFEENIIIHLKDVAPFRFAHAANSSASLVSSQSQTITLVLVFRGRGDRFIVKSESGF